MAENRTDRIENIPGQLPVNQQTLDILVANIIPTSRYFEARFDNMEDKVKHLQDELTGFRTEVVKRFDDMEIKTDKRFDDMEIKTDKRFDDMEIRTDKRFDDMEIRTDKRFEQVDKRFEQVISSIERLTDKLEDRDERQRGFTLKMFTVSITISILGVTGIFLKTLGVV